MTSAATAQVAARGVIFIATAKFYFLGAGYAIQFGLAHILSKELYGAYGTVLSVVNVLNMMVLQGTLQTVSKLVSENEANAGAIQRTAVRTQAVLVGGIAALYALLGGFIAELQNNPALATPFRISAVIVLAYGFYAIFVGSLNGRKEFRAQAGLDMTFATLRAGGILGLAALGFGVTGALAGFAGAALLIVGISIVVSRRGSAPTEATDAGGASSTLSLVRFMLPVMLYTLILYALMNVDLWLLRSFSAAGAQETDRIAALYYGAQNIARIPYQAIMAVTFVVFPLVSRATFDKDTDAARGYIAVTFRYSLIFLAGLVAIVAANATDLLAIPYPQAYQEGARFLEPLAAGMLLFSLFNIANAILIGAGCLRAAVQSGVVGLAVAVGAMLGLREVTDFDGRVAAVAAAAGYFAGCVVAGCSLYKRFGAPVSWLTVVRVGGAAAIVAVASHVRPTGGRIVTAVSMVGLIVLYGLLLWASREWGPADSDRFRRAFKKRQGGASR